MPSNNGPPVEREWSCIVDATPGAAVAVAMQLDGERYRLVRPARVLKWVGSRIWLRVPPDTLGSAAEEYVAAPEDLLEPTPEELRRLILDERLLEHVP